jgi:hypothetical protein
MDSTSDAETLKNPPRRKIHLQNETSYLSRRLWRLLYCAFHIIGHTGHAKWQTCGATVHPA